MKKSAYGVILAAALGGAAHAQTAQDLLRDSNGGSTDNVLTYGMGYHQQRYSTLRQINKNTVKRLVPMWTLSWTMVAPQKCASVLPPPVVFSVPWTIVIPNHWNDP